MKPSLILMSHGNFAHEIMESAKMILGEVSGYHTVCMTADDGFEGTSKKLQSCLNEMNDVKDIIILADLYGGTPFNIGNIFSKKEKDNFNIRLIAGMNFAMLLEYFSSDKEDINELVNDIISTGKDAILEPSLNEEDDDDIDLD
ncbi:PTS sugar transporter subunit IIA [Brachyspira pilosicoli]|uniref:PTS sugar transporter subunit IIA n=1 Tax=Brachyspira pilosicoli TaxID=52584 RepID=A0A5C8F940_BRAPL|nr:PTS sugar transporter subunit IIA [Brachyspira pilosicoli]TXJ46807.1 PTS sugar transporter subunit IIA [Brachyspira pilosicoli]